MTHAQAREILRTAWRQVHGRAPTEAELTYSAAIASLETGYGRAGQFGALAARGQYNWGALERRRSADGTCPPGTAPGSDVGQVCFYVFDSDVEAAAAFLRTLTVRRPAVTAAMRGSPEDVARAMRLSPAYYEGPPGDEDAKVRYYASAIRRNIAAAGRPVPSGGNGGGLSLGTAVILATAAGAGYWWYTEGRKT